MVEAVAIVAVVALVVAFGAVLAGAFWVLRLTLRNAQDVQEDLLNRVQAGETAAYTSMSARAEQKGPGMDSVPSAPSMDKIDSEWLNLPESELPFDDDLQGEAPPRPVNVAGSTPVRPGWAEE